jgi:hypothetical protein
MGGDGIDEADAGVEILPDLVFDPLQLEAVGIPDIRHGLNG